MRDSGRRVELNKSHNFSAADAEVRCRDWAIGDYTENRALVLFLQTLARQNHGDFVGVSR